MPAFGIKALGKLRVDIVPGTQDPDLDLRFGMVGHEQPA